VGRGVKKVFKTKSHPIFPAGGRGRGVFRHNRTRQNELHLRLIDFVYQPRRDLLHVEIGRRKTPISFTMQ
jgi:hypothetical protein